MNLHQLLRFTDKHLDSAVVVKHTVSILDLSAQDQEGTMINNRFIVMQLRVNSEFDVLPTLRIGENLQFTYRSVLGLQGDATVVQV